MSIEKRLEELGIVLPATEGQSYYGANCGTMKPFHIHGSALHLSGHVPERSGAVSHAGLPGELVTLE